VPSVLIVDDNSDIRSLVRILVEAADGLEVIGEAAGGGEALRVWADTHPDVIVLDQAMPELTGMEVAEIILGEQPEQIIVMFTANAENRELGSALSSGVRAVVSKEDILSLITTIRRCCPAGAVSGHGSPRKAR
jgi:CheY-like chemotaxis protein